MNCWRGKFDMTTAGSVGDVSECHDMGEVLGACLSKGCALSKACTYMLDMPIESCTYWVPGKDTARPFGEAAGREAGSMEYKSGALKSGAVKSGALKPCASGALKPCALKPCASWRGGKSGSGGSPLKALGDGAII